MNPRDRLRLLKAAGAARTEGERAVRGPASDSGLVFARADAPEAAPAGGAPRPYRLAEGLDGFLTQTDAGEAFYLERRYALATAWGPLPLKHALQLPAGAWTQLGRVAPGFAIDRAVFFDTETTGLAGGTGTYAFLVGLGFFQGGQFVVRQYFLRDYPEEDALLAAIAADLAPYSSLVSFNGKSFDWPLLETRFRLNRRRVPLAGAPHLDLLHPARRIWRDRLGSCSLQSLEREVLGLQRQGDVPGSQIPALYFDYLRSGDLSHLAEIIDHNRLDILSLVALAGWMGQMVTEPLGSTPDGELLPGDDLYQLGRLFESRSCLGEALTCYEAALQRGVAVVSEQTLLRQLSTAYKRAKEQQQAVAIWERMIEGRGSLSLFPYIELAKHHEHTTRRYDVAERLTLQALEVAEQRRSLSGAYGPAALREYREVEHRLRRLQRKLGQGPS